MTGECIQIQENIFIWIQTTLHLANQNKSYRNPRPSVVDAANM